MRCLETTRGSSEGNTAFVRVQSDGKGSLVLIWSHGFRPHRVTHLEGSILIGRKDRLILFTKGNNEMSRSHPCRSLEVKSSLPLGADVASVHTEA